MTRQSIFVFGSNLLGRHGAGSALAALEEHGAILGQGEGLQGNSYAIPTKNKYMRVMSLDKIETYVVEFRQFAIDHPEMEFNVVAIGCGFAGYTPEDMAPMFTDMPENVKLPPEFVKVLNELMS
jgi:hypothetical protein